MTNDDISCFLYFSVIPSKKSRCFWLSNSGGLRLTTLQKLRVVILITVDCGISNNDEIAHANDLGIEVIVTDHHNPPENLPEAIIIIDPKIEDSNYPFDGISGAAVAYKLVSALRFADTDFYGAEICLLELTENQEENCIYADCLKIKG